jgi:hypothetical protein
MLNLYVNFMKIRFLILFTFLLVAAQDSSPVAIISPATGDIISGEVTITGTTDVFGFASSQLDFAYASDSTDTWFALQSSSQPVVDSPITTWDTSLITDGDYILRLRVTLDDNTFEDAIVQVKVQNDAPIQAPASIVSSTPDQLSAQIPTAFLVASSPTPTPTLRPTPTPLPTNAVSLNQASIYTSLGRGALVILGLFLFAGLILRFRRY